MAIVSSPELRDSTYFLPSLASSAKRSKVLLHLASSFSAGLTVEAREVKVEATREKMPGASESAMMSCYSAVEV